MAYLSLCEISQSQLSSTPVKDGQLVCCLDTGNFYRDTASGRIVLGADVIFVESLPLAPLSNKIYLLKPNKLYIFDSDWIQVNEIPETIITKDSIYEFPSVGSVNCIYISRTENKTYRWSDDDLKYYCVGSDWNDIKIINCGSSSSE